jgi:hypothetical protein
LEEALVAAAAAISKFNIGSQHAIVTGFPVMRCIVETLNTAIRIFPDSSAVDFGSKATKTKWRQWTNFGFC